MKKPKVETKHAGLQRLVLSLEARIERLEHRCVSLQGEVNHLKSHVEAPLKVERKR